jgi:protein-L-isoaspartate O-methyltransferase
MAQYQSFPGAEGDSRTLEKLKALNLPDLLRRRFLDVGCNEGFFCGFARFQGAERVVGIDHSRLFIERARQRFPDCEFHLQGWDALPDGPFDVILLASSLHYADDQGELIRRLVDRLSPEGVLVLELGIVSLAKSEWVKVKRGIDERFFPTMAKLREVLTNYAWKWMGPSVLQDGDPVARHVVHISRRRPMAYLLLQPPGSGKSSIASALFTPVGVPTVSGDEVILQIATGKREASPVLQQLLATDFSPFRIDQSIRRVFDAGLGSKLVDLWCAQVTDQASFALDAYVPDEHQHVVEAALAAAGYFPVSLCWGRLAAQIPSAPVAAAQAEAYFMSLAEVGATSPASSSAARAFPAGGLGHVDECTIGDGELTLRGWAVTTSGAPARMLAVRLGAETRTFDAFERQPRPDVQRHLNLGHPLYGYRLQMPVPSGADVDSLLCSLEVRAGDAKNRMGAALPFAESQRRHGGGRP